MAIATHESLSILISWVAIAGEAIDQIEQNPSLTQRLLSAAKAGSLAAIESMLNHPAASFVIAVIEDLNEE